MFQEALDGFDSDPALLMTFSDSAPLSGIFQGRCGIAQLRAHRDQIGFNGLEDCGVGLDGDVIMVCSQAPAKQLQLPRLKKWLSSCDHNMARGISPSLSKLQSLTHNGANA